MSKHTKFQIYAGLVLNVVVISAAAFGAAMYSF